MIGFSGFALVKTKRPATWLAAAALAALLAGCGEKTPAEADASKSQIAARIGAEVVTVPEVDHELRLANVPADKRRDPEILKRVLRDLVARKYLARQAKDAKLDREPTVLLDILRAREQVMANALLSRDVNARAGALTQEQVDRYIAGNPQKFGSRMLMAVDQIVFPAGPTLQTVIDETRDAKSLEEIATKLSALGLPMNRGAGVMSSGDLSADMNAALRAQKPEDVFFIRLDSNGVFFKVREMQPRPLQGEQAQAAARQMMRADMMKAQLNQAMFLAISDAKFEGDYAKIMDEAGGEKAP